MAVTAERRSRRRVDRGLIILALIALVVLATAVYAWLELRVDQITDALRRRQPIAALVIVSDGDRLAFAEAFLYHSATRKAALYHVPPNLGGVIASLNRVDGIDALYRRASPASFVRRVEEVLGVTLQCWIDVSVDEVGRIADLLGGLDLFIPNPVEVSWQERRILLPSGSVRLDGDKLIDYLLYEDALEAESERVGRQQKAIQALLAGLGEHRTLLAHGAPARLLRSSMRTSLPARALTALVDELGRFDAGRMVLQRVLGNVRAVDGRDLLFPHQEGEVLKESVRQTLEANASSEYVSAEELTVTVEVLNGTPTGGLAARAREVLMSYEFEVLQPRNADSDAYEHTVVIDRRGRPEAARRVAEVLACTRVEESREEDVDPSVDVTVILGRDFDGRSVTP